MWEFDHKYVFLFTQTSGDCPLGGSVGAAQVNCRPARVFLIGTGDKNSGAGLSGPYTPVIYILIYSYLLFFVSFLQIVINMMGI